MDWIGYLRPILVLLFGIDVFPGAGVGGRQQQLTADEFILVCCGAGESVHSGHRAPRGGGIWGGTGGRRNGRFCLFCFCRASFCLAYSAWAMCNQIRPNPAQPGWYSNLGEEAQVKDVLRPDHSVNFIWRKQDICSPDYMEPYILKKKMKVIF